MLHTPLGKYMVGVAESSPASTKTMTDNSQALPDRTHAILSVNVIVPRVGRRRRSLGTVFEMEENGRRVFSFRPRSGDEVWRFVATNSIASHAITVDEFAKTLQSRGEVEALWDEIEGHPVVIISVPPISEEDTQREPLLVAKRWLA